MEVESVEVGSLKFDPNNARKHDDKNLEAIKGSLEAFGQQKPIVVTKSGKVIAGNGTLEAAKALGWTHIDVVRTSLKSRDAMAYALADNRSAELAAWDDEVLNATLRELDAMDFDVEAIGFDMPEDSETKEGLTDDDEIPEVEENEFGVERGQIWQLGEHRLMCGDSTSKDDVNRLMAGEKADMVFTDPPYNMEAEGGSNQPIGRAAAKLGEAIKHLCDFDPEKFLEILPSVFENKKMNAYIFCNKDLVPEYLNWARKNCFSFNILVWKKPNAIPLGRQHRPDLEYLILFRKSAIWNNGINGVNYSKLLQHDRENSTSHPTMKPVALIENQILIGSNRDSLICEPFCGSGSTLIACEKTGRKCYGMEIDPHYCSVIIKRWQDFTGNQATLLTEK